MTEELNQENSPTPRQPETDVIGLLKMMQQQLTFLEKKMDILISQSQQSHARPAPYRDTADRGEGPRERNFADRDRAPRERSFRPRRPFQKRHGEEGRPFGGPRKEFSDNRENSFDPGRRFKKPFGGPKRGFAPGKKPFFRKQRRSE